MDKEIVTIRTFLSLRLQNRIDDIVSLLADSKYIFITTERKGKQHTGSNNIISTLHQVKLKNIHTDHLRFYPESSFGTETLQGIRCECRKQLWGWSLPCTLKFRFTFLNGKIFSMETI